MVQGRSGRCAAGSGDGFLREGAEARPGRGDSRVRDRRSERRQRSSRATGRHAHKASRPIARAEAMTTAKVSRAEMRHRVSELRLPDQKPLRIVVAGEVILDRYVWGDVERVSPEAPIPILRAARREEKPGNAGFVMANLRALGALPVALSVVGNDRNGRMLQQIFRDLGIDTRALLVDPDRPTTVKERMLGSVQSAHRATQQLLRVDEEDGRPLAP